MYKGQFLNVCLSPDHSMLKSQDPLLCWGSSKSDHSAHVSSLPPNISSRLTFRKRPDPCHQCLCNSPCFFIYLSLSLSLSLLLSHTISWSRMIHKT